MLSLIGCLLLLSTATCSLIFVKSNIEHNLTITTTNPTLEWQENGNTIFTLSYDSATGSCYPFPPKSGFEGYCIDNGGTYVLTILDTANHDGSVFTGNKEICLIVFPTSSQVTVTPNTIKVGEPVQIEVDVVATKPKPSLLVSTTVNGLTKNFTVETTPSCVLMDYKIPFELNITKLVELYDQQTFSEGINISLNARPYYDDFEKEFFGPTTPNISITFEPEGSSSPPTISPSSSLQPTSSPPNPSTSLTSQTTTTCDNLSCDRELRVIVISICVCVGSLIVVVVIILSCCCCPCCPCYRRNKEERDEKECKCCSLICICGNKKHDEESETRERVCECCCCSFCVCYKRKKKTEDRKYKQNAARSEQYEMNSTNHPTNINSGYNYRVRRQNRPDQRTRANQPTRAIQSTRPTESNYATRPTKSYYGRGYNNATFDYYGANERGRDMDRKPRVTQRPYTNYYYY